MFLPVEGLNAFVGTMALMRLASAAVELTAAYLMARYNRVDAALRINGLLGLVGPTILVAVSAVGLVGLADRLAPSRMLLVLAGVLLIVAGTR